ncbi:MAG: fused MFS/spermidine synthase [Chloroflexi bacterium]|nr:fused MFS/spermidine synthase [Chloroflexota bacterium]
MKKYFLHLTVFFSGMTALSVELSASRLLGNVYGSSNLVWASIIGLILIYLTIGYWLGGKIADKNPQYRVFYRILLWGSLAVGLVPMVSRPILRITANAFDQFQMPILTGAFVTVMILFIIPVTLLGMVSPFALKLLLKDASDVGKTAGALSAISTLGSFIGTFLPVLVLVPLIGTYRTFLFFSSLLMVIASIGFCLYVGFKPWLRYAWMPLILILLWLFGARGADKATKNLIFEGESAYNYVQVVEEQDYRYLHLNEGQGIHSIYHPIQLNYYGPWSQVLVAPFFNLPSQSKRPIEKMAILGLAAGTTARQAQAVFGDIQIDGFEIDPLVVEVGRKYFDMNQPNLNIYVQDGRWGLSRMPGDYDIISVDAYRPPYIPWHMTTLEFFQLVYEKLSDEGVMVINIGRSPTDRTLINDLGTTICQVFPTIFIMDLPESFNTILFATKQPGSWENFFDHYNLLVGSDVHPLLLEVMAMTITYRQPTPEITRVFTDDIAPIEWLTNKLVVDFFLSGGLKDFQ